MDLTRRQVETLLNVSSQDLDTFILEKNLPCYLLGEEKRFNLSEIESWLIVHKFWESSATTLPYNLYRALTRGGYFVIDDLGDASILKLGAFHLAKKLGLDEEVLYSMLQDRQSLSSTAMGGGFAIPHTRERLEGIHQDILFVVHLKNPIEFEAIDRQKVHTFFFLMAASDKTHLNLLSKLAHMMAQGQARAYFHSNATQETVLKGILDWEQAHLKP